MFDWLQHLADWLIYDVLGQQSDTHLGAALNFFVYDTVKILLLLLLITVIMGMVNLYFPVEKLRNFLNSRRLFGLEYLLAAVFGAVTPFCSCSSVPLFIGFVKGGIPLGVTFAFLITSPLVNEVAIAIFLGMFGLKTTLIYVASGVALGTVGGWILGQFRTERWLTDWVKQMPAFQTAGAGGDADGPSLRAELPGVVREALTIVRGVLPYVLVGIAIGAAMHGYVPEGFFEQYIGQDVWYAVPLAIVLAVPMYANAAGILPVIQVFVAKGIPLGTSLAFMMGVIGLSVPEATLLRKVMTPRLIFLFFSVVTLCIVFSGYMFKWAFG